MVNERIITLLERAYGVPKRRKRSNPLEELIFTLLSQNTSDRNRDKAWEAMKGSFPTWQGVVRTGEARLARAIRPGGLSRIKAGRIIGILREIKGRYGRYDLGFLRRLPRDQARKALLSFNGVGPKTAACVLLFSCGLPAFPVDTHIHRVTMRLGLIPPKTTREKAHDILERMVPEHTYYSFHINLIRHGRTICKARAPRCGECILLRMCPYGKKHVGS